MKHYGFTYNTNKKDFGKIISIFEVEPDWEGFRHHGYGAAPIELEQKLDREEISWEEFVSSL